jgi:subtilisin family serine protease
VVHYYYNNEKVSFEVNHNEMLIWTTTDISAEVQEIIGSSYEIINIAKQKQLVGILNPINTQQADLTLLHLKSSKDVSASKATGIKNAVELLPSVQYISFAIVRDNKRDRFFAKQVYVKLKSIADIGLLEQETKKVNVIILGQNESMPLWYILTCTKNSIGASNDVANRLHESKLFEFAEPDIANSVEANCVNDPLFGTQWYLNNTGQTGGTAGVDIRACNAWQVTTGNANIITAVTDEGFEMNHPDLQANVFGTGFDVNAGSAPSITTGPHGTQCAGLISAVQNNVTGISGVAPTARIMSISMDFGPTLTNQMVANGINFAWQNGASVISNSWGWPGSMIPSGSTIVTDAIANALNNGRNGLGSVVVFSSGNDNINGAQFPGNSDPRIICVGAVDRCGQRSGRADIITNGCDAWCPSCLPASSFGAPVDIVAGGSGVQTTDRVGAAGVAPGDYDADYGGTSAACPIAAGVAALILSVNPCLNQASVHDIICRSGQKLPNFTFANTAARPQQLGTWNNEVGHGLVNAELAVRLAGTMFLQNESISSSSGNSGLTDFNYLRFEAGEAVDVSRPVGTYIVTNTGNLTLLATESIVLRSGFTATAGCNFSATIVPNLACNHSNPVIQGARMAKQSDGSAATITDLTKYTTLYPNPTNGLVNIKFSLQTSTLVTLALYDFTGRELYKNSSNKLAGDYDIPLDISLQLPASMYIVKVCLGAECETLRFIKSNNE